MGAPFLVRTRPWLISLMVTLVLLLAFTAGPRLKRSTVEGKFNYIDLGMEQEQVLRVLGPSRESNQVTPRTWSLEGYTIEIWFDEGKRVISKILRRNR